MFSVSRAVRGGWQSQFFCSQNETWGGDRNAQIATTLPAASRCQGAHSPFLLQVGHLPPSSMSLWAFTDRLIDAVGWRKGVEVWGDVQGEAGAALGQLCCGASHGWRWDIMPCSLWEGLQCSSVVPGGIGTAHAITWDWFKNAFPAICSMCTNALVSCKGKSQLSTAELHLPML